MATLTSGRSEIAIEILDRLAPRHDEIADQVFAAVTSEIGDYQDDLDRVSHGYTGSEQFWEDVRAFGDKSIQMALESAREEGKPDREDLEFVREATIRRVDQKVPLDAILHAFRIGHRVVWSTVIDEADSLSDDRSALVELTLPFMRYVDSVCTCIAETYVREQHRIETVADQAASDLMERLLAGDDAAREPAREAGIAVDDSHLVAVATLNGDPDAQGLRRLAGTLQRALAPDPSLVVTRGPEVVCLVPVGVGDPGEIADRCGSALAETAGSGPLQHRAGISLPATDLTGIAAADRQARSALALTSDERPVVYLGRMSIMDYLLAREDRVASALVPAEVRKLAESDSAMDRALVKTLFAYLEADMNVKRCAALLPAHPNTVHYRLNRLEELTGHSHRDVGQLMELVVAVRLARAEKQLDEPG